VINKAQGMVVHPGAGNHQGTLANALLYRRLEKLNEPFNTNQIQCQEIINLQSQVTDNLKTQSLRPGIVHRLDKDTSGLIVAAWDERAHAFLASQFKKRKARKTYAAIVCGCPKADEGRIDKLIARSKRDRKTFTVSDTEGRKSLTLYKLVHSYGKYSLLLLRPKTGRTHQIRVHLKYLGTPILGDPIYGITDPVYKNASLMLHAKRLSIMLPGSAELKTFRTPLPERFKNIMRLERGKAR